MKKLSADLADLQQTLLRRQADLRVQLKSAESDWLNAAEALEAAG